MATRNISGIIAGNYTLSGVYASLVIEPAAEIQGQLSLLHKSEDAGFSAASRSHQAGWM